MQEFKYDVAFSFLKEDEPFAFQLNQLLKDRYETFVYFRKQDQVVGKDGEQEFAETFGKDSRVVVVLFRNSWGKTTWTRIEETAIRNRAYVEGYDFTIFIPMDKDPSLPRWLPRPQIWFDLNRYGLQGAVTVVEARIRQAGGQNRPESVQDQATRLKDQLALKEKRDSFFGSSARFGEAKQAFEEVKGSLNLTAGAISNTHTGLSIKIEQGIDSLTFKLLGFTLSVYYENAIRDDRLHHPRLYTRFSEIDRDQFKHQRQFNVLQTYEFDFDVDLSGENGWRETSRARRFFTSASLADFAFKNLLEIVSAFIAKTTP